VDDGTMTEAVLSSEGKLQILHDGEKELLAYATNVSGIRRLRNTTVIFSIARRLRRYYRNMIIAIIASSGIFISGFGE
jgi:hypothetical protein